jgi:murein DD-endopeptidase MepM/ murein hydrolase activator NlpD
MKEGNNIVNLSNKSKIPVEKILAANNFRNADFIPAGELVFIPDAKPQNIFDGFLWPVSGRRITCGFGWRKNPFNNEYMEFHKGLDIAARYESVRATKYGMVSYAGWMGGYGNVVIIAHPGGWKSLYGHLSRIMVKPGQYVKQGQQVARSGNTGRSRSSPSF